MALDDHSTEPAHDAAVPTLDLSGPLDASEPKVELKPYDPTRAQDHVRLIVTGGLLFMLLVVLIWGCWESASWNDHWEHAKELLQIFVPALIGLLGSVIGFYFGSKKAERKQQS